MDNIDRLVADGALDQRHADTLDEGVRQKINEMDPADIAIMIKFHTTVSEGKPWQPEPDGSVF